MADEARPFVRRLQKQSQTNKIDVIQTGLGEDRILDLLSRAAPSEQSAMIVVGTAAATVEDLRTGDAIIYSAVIDESGHSQTLSPELSTSLQQILSSLNPRQCIGLTTKTPITEPREKTKLGRKHAASCIDMETAIVASYAASMGRPIACVRVILDTAEQAIPQPALDGLCEDGTTNIWRLTRSLVSKPAAVPQLLKLGSQYRAALNTINAIAALVFDNVDSLSAENC